MQVTVLPMGKARGATNVNLRFAASIRQGSVNAPARKTMYADAKAIKAERIQYGERQAALSTPKVILRKAAHNAVG